MVINRRRHRAGGGCPRHFRLHGVAYSRNESRRCLPSWLSSCGRSHCLCIASSDMPRAKVHTTRGELCYYARKFYSVRVDKKNSNPTAGLVLVHTNDDENIPIASFRLGVFFFQMFLSQTQFVKIKRYAISLDLSRI